MKHILFVTPKLGRSGSEFYLHNLIRNIDPRTFKITVYTIQKGDFVGAIKTIKYYSLDSYLELQRKPLKSIKNKIFGRRNLEERFFLSVVKKVNPSLIYINTLAIPNYLELSKMTNIPMVLHVHELEQALFHNNFQNEIICKDVKKVVACSEANKSVIKTLGYTGDLTVLPPAIDTMSIKPNKSSTALKKQLGIKKNDFVLIMSGSTDVNKDPITFLKSAERLLKLNKSFKFLWIGGDFEKGIGLYVEKLTAALRLSEKVKWISHINSNLYYDYLNLADCLMLTSRRDSFPLVMIENAFLGKPIVSFNSGGVAEFVNQATIGSITKNNHIEDLVESVMEIYNNYSRINSHTCKDRASEFDIKLNASKWANEISKLF